MFLNPIMLAGLGGALVPLVLHFLSCARYREIEWGGMMFLEEGGSERRRTSSRVKQWALLLVRMGLVGLVAMAMARPVVMGWGASSDARVTAVVLLDVSPSMGTAEAGRTRLERAKEVVLRILAGLRRGDQAALILMGDTETKFEGARADLQAVASRVAEVRVGTRMADVAEGLERAAALLDRFPDDRREVYLVSDRQAVSWRSLVESSAPAWRARLAGSTGDMTFTVARVGGVSTENVAVELVAVLNAPAIKGSATDVDVRVRNYGKAPRPGMAVTLRIDRRIVGHGEVSVAGGETATVRIPVVFEAEGSRWLTAEVAAGGDEDFDNELSRAVEVIRPVRVLIVSGDQRGSIGRREVDYLKIALTPFTSAGKKGIDPAEVEIIESIEGMVQKLKDADVVVLANVPQVDAPAGRALEQFVYGGGGLLVAPGNLVRIENYNQVLYRDGSGLMPVKLTGTTPLDGSAATSVLGVDLSHPVFAFLAGRTDPIPSAVVGRYFLTEGNGGKVLASYVSGAPFVVESEFGKGRVMMTTTPLDADWNSLPMTNFYLPFAQSMARYLTAGARVDRNLAIGGTIEATVDGAATQVRLIRPSGRDDGKRVEVSAGPEQAELRYAETSSPGLYTLRYRAGKEDVALRFVVARELAESDLSPMEPARWEQYRTGLEFGEVDWRGGAEALGLSRPARDGYEIWLPMLLAAMGLGVVEMALARRWGGEGNA